MKIRETVGVFDNLDNMEEAISELEISGFGRRHISVLGSESAVKEHFGKSHVSVEQLEDNPETPRAPNIKPEELHLGQGALIGGGILVGAVAVVLASGVAGVSIPVVMMGSAGGATMGTVFARLLGKKYVEFFQKQIDEGGLLVWVKTSSPEAEENVCRIMLKHGGKDVHVHELDIQHDNENISMNHGICSLLIRLDNLREEHHQVIADDAIISNKLWKIFLSLERVAANQQHLSAAEAKEIKNRVEDAAAYARSMAEKEQKNIICDSHDSPSKQKEEYFRYLRLAIRLKEFQDTYLQNILHTENNLANQD